MAAWIIDMNAIIVAFTYNIDQSNKIKYTFVVLRLG